LWKVATYCIFEKKAMQKVAVVCGGYSGEAEVSMRSAAMVMEHIDKDLYFPVKVVIQPDRWYAEWKGTEVEVNRNDFSVMLDGQSVQFDGAFIIVHGTPGENGLLQGYFDMIGLPYTTGDVLNMAITFNKKATTTFLKSLGFSVAESVVLYENVGWEVSDIINQVGLPCFVKPNNGGSSIGTSKVKQEGELSAAIEKAFKEDRQVIVESFLDGTEVTCGVIQWQGKVMALPMTEIVTQNEFFDFEAKYKGQSNEITPARIEKALFDEIQSLSESIYAQLKCRGMIRVDFIIQSQVPHVVEVNTVPGFSAASIIPQQAACVGIDKTALISAVIQSCF
jgi:D-alanine-D-alanine ligase